MGSVKKEATFFENALILAYSIPALGFANIVSGLIEDLFFKELSFRNTLNFKNILRWFFPVLISSLIFILAIYFCFKIGVNLDFLTRILMFIPLLFLFIIILYFSFEMTVNFCKAELYFRQIRLDMLNDREYIANFFSKIITSNYHSEKFILYLENNIKTVHGKFPDSFLRPGQSRYLTRLIQLEERWREAEEREIVSQ